MVQPSQIREHMEIVGSDDKHVGKVDHVRGSDIELTRELAVGKHHYLPLSLIASVDEKVRLSCTGDAAKDYWREA